jgi:peptidoglycan/LPS O-acetylase OafA/YrhL
LALFILTKPLHFEWSGWQYYYLTYTANLAFLSHNGGLYLGSFNINHFWSLQVEEQFYLVWPFVLYRVRKIRTRVRICLITSILIFCIRTGVLMLLKHHALEGPYMTSAPTFCCADNLLFGCYLAIVMRTQWREKVLRLAPRVLSISAVILLGFAIPNRGLDPWPGASPIASDLIQTLGFSLIGLSCTALIAMALKPASQTQRMFGNSTLRFFGKYSYGIYVFHYSINGFLMESLRLFFNQHAHSRAIGVVAPALIIAGISVLAALLSYHLYEVHFLRLKRYFSYRRPAESSELPSHG